MSKMDDTLLEVAIETRDALDSIAESLKYIAGAVKELRAEDKALREAPPARATENQPSPYDAGAVRQQRR